ncbi:MAG: hypothetical protein M3Y20_09050 [Actinomycetota bacterium]|nr:hypothetical protein [Actinomycetota bacterium]
MRLHSRILGTASVAALTLGVSLAAAAPASAGSASDSDGTSKVTLKVKDVVTKKGTFQVKKWVTFGVQAPADYTSSGGQLVQSEWRVSAYDNYVSGVSCNLDVRSPQAAGEYHTGAGSTVSFDLPKTKGLTKDPKGLYKYLYWGSGKCTVTASVSISQAGDYTQGISSYYKSYSLTTTYRNQTTPKVTFSAPSKVKKNKSFKVSGKVTAPSPVDGYKTKNAKKGTKVAIQFQKNGKGAWKTIKVTKVGKSGKFSVKVKTKAKGKIRAVSQTTNVLAKKASSAKKIKLG